MARLNRSWGLTKPPPGTQVNRGHPLAHGLISAVPLNEGAGKPTDVAQNLTLGIGSFTTMPAWGMTQMGPGLVFTKTTSDGVKIGLVNSIAPTDGLTMIAWTTMTGSSAQKVAPLYCDAGVSNTEFQLFGSLGSGSGGPYGAWLGGSQFDQANGSTTALITDQQQVQVFAFVHRPNGSGAGRLFRNGVLIATGATGATGTPPTTAAFWIGNSPNDTSVAHKGIVVQTLVYRRGLSDAEIKRLYHEPFAWAMPPTPRLFIIGADSGTTTTQISDTETGSGTDAGESIAATVSDTETGTGTDAGESVAAALADTESGSGTDAGESVAVALAGTDTGSEADAGEAVSVSIADADTATGTDAESSVALADAETAAGADVEAVAATFSDTDSATGTDADSSIADAISDSDAGTGTEAEALAAALSDAETTTGTEAESVAIAISDSDSASGVDAESLAVAMSDIDTAAATDAQTLANALADAETLAALDAELNIVAALIDAETAAAIEDGSVALALSDADTATAVDDGSVAVQILVDWQVEASNLRWRVTASRLRWELEPSGPRWRVRDSRPRWEVES